MSGRAAAMRPASRRARPLRVLHLEDSALDAELVAERLRLEGYRPEVTRVETRGDFERELRPRSETFDLILADLSLPDFDGMAALAIARERAPDIPFLFVSGTIGEEAAIEAIRRGATDYVVKERLSRLGFVISRALGEVQERTDRRAAEAALRESEARFRHLADSAPALIWMTDANGRVSFANMHFDHVFGRPAAEMLGNGWEQTFLPEELDPFRTAFLAAFRDRAPFRTEIRVRDRAGQVRWMRVEGVPRLNDAGEFLGYTGCAVDITEARLAAGELERRIATRTAELSQALAQLHDQVLERERAEEALRQSQKMEAVGQLTGGIAHDFNNLLTVVRGSLELMQRRVEQGRAADLGRYVGSAQQAVHRAAELTQRLLAFARRQALDPRQVEPHRLVAGMVELIRRTIGPSIKVQLQLGDGVSDVLCDGNQLENALLNLAINARDAMPAGGTLTLATADVTLSPHDVAGEGGVVAGDYVEISIRDTGQGMTPEVRERAFEPFFTTKPIGHGTGLGLSQVYGFVQQSGGFVRLESDPDGGGTTVRLYLPRHESTEATAGPDAAAESESVTAYRHATVLLVDDEAQVRAEPPAQ